AARHDRDGLRRPRPPHPSAARELAGGAAPPLERAPERPLPRPLVESDGHQAQSGSTRRPSARYAGLRLGALAARSHRGQGSGNETMKSRKIHFERLLGKQDRDPGGVKAGRIFSAHAEPEGDGWVVREYDLGVGALWVRLGLT